jgi:hypothetical protein
MNDLEYYKALYEQLQAQLNLIEKRFDISKFNKSKKKDKKSTKDYDGDGEVESSKDEYFGSKDKAIKKSMSKKKKTLKEGTVISGNHFNFGGFPRILNESENISPRKSRDGTEYPSEEYEKLAQASDAAGRAAAAAESAALQFHQNAAKEWGAIFDNAPAFNRSLGNSGRRRAGFANRGKHMDELPHRMLRDPDMRKLKADALAARTAAILATQARNTHPHHEEFMKRAQSTSDSVYGTRGNLGS